MGKDRPDPVTPARIVSFGYGHGPTPEAHITIDVRHHFKDPHVNPALRHLTAEDPDVIDAVMSTPGIPQLIDAAADTVRAFRSGPQPGPIVLAIGCAGGRHRAAVIAAMTTDLLNSAGIPATLTHRDMHRPVITRDTPGALRAPLADPGPDTRTRHPQAASGHHRTARKEIQR